MLYGKPTTGELLAQNLTNESMELGLYGGIPQPSKKLKVHLDPYDTRSFSLVEADHQKKKKETCFCGSW